MSVSFFILATVALAGAVAAMSLPRLIHCAFSLVVAFGALAGIYLQLHAEFVGLAQILVYVGAVAILIVFAIMLTRGGDDTPGEAPLAGRWAGVGVAALVFATLAGLILGSRVTQTKAAEAVQVTVKSIGLKLMGDYVVALEVIGLLLTAALIGAVIIAMHEGGKAVSGDGSKSGPDGGGAMGEDG
jgi:NADH-quinone oxidoreductase subunit J